MEWADNYEVRGFASNASQHGVNSLFARSRHGEKYHVRWNHPQEQTSSMLEIAGAGLGVFEQMGMASTTTLKREEGLLMA